MYKQKLYIIKFANFFCYVTKNERKKERKKKKLLGREGRQKLYINANREKAPEGDYVTNMAYHLV
jgi:hypothetical protein